MLLTGAGTTTTDGRARSPHHQPPGSETTWDSCWRAETKKGIEEPTGRDASVQAHHIIGRDEVHWSAHAPETPSTCLCHMGPMIRPSALPCRSAQPRSRPRSAAASQLACQHTAAATNKPQVPPCAVPLVSNLSLRPTEHWGPGRRKPRATGLHASNQPNIICMRVPCKPRTDDDEEKRINNGARRSS